MNYIIIENCQSTLFYRQLFPNLETMFFLIWKRTWFPVFLDMEMDMVSSKVRLMRIICYIVKQTMETKVVPKLPFFLSFIMENGQKLLQKMA